MYSAVKQSASDSPQEIPEHGPKGMPGRISDILLGGSVVTFSMIAVPAILLALVFHYRVEQNPDIYPSLALPSSDIDGNAIYVEISATTLIFIASWASTIDVTLTGWIMNLVSYPVARNILRRSEENKIAQLPTPYQLNILVDLLCGSNSSLWTWARYTFGSKNKRHKTVTAVRLAARLFSFVMFLCLLISLADTWLHIATKTVPFVQINDVPVLERHMLGRGLSPNCVEWQSEDHVINSPCTLNVAATNIFLMNSTEAYRTVNNISTLNRIEYHTQETEYAFLVDAKAPEDIDYQANTFAVSTQCKPMSQDCNLGFGQFGAATPFNCSSINFSGDGGVGVFKTKFFTDFSGKEKALLSTTSNPFYFAVVAGIDSADPDSPIHDDPEINHPVHGGISIVLYCESTVYDTTYSKVANQIASFDVVPSNSTMGSMVAGPLSQSFEETSLQEGLRLSAISDSAQEMADKFSKVVSRTGLGLATGQLSPLSSIAEQSRTETFVARVPKAPLYTVVALCLAYAVLGLCLALIAILSSNAIGVRDTQARLSIPGLVAESFPTSELGRPVKQVEDFIEERKGEGSVRVGTSQSTLGGWMYNAWSIQG